MDQIFNERSVNGSYNNSAEASYGMERSLCLAITMSRCGLTKTIRTTRDFSQQKLSAGYTVYDWAVDKNAPCAHEIRHYYLTHAAKSPYIEEFIENLENDNSQCIEFKLSGEIAHGLGLASIWDSVAISLDSDEVFRKDSLTLQRVEISEDGNTLESSVSVSTLWHESQVPKIGAELQKQARFRVHSGNELIANFKVLFPLLELTDKACRQLKCLHGSEQHFPEIVRHLAILNETMKNWIRGSFEPRELTFSCESSSTLNKYSSDRTFVCADGRSRLFEMHTKIMSSNQRIHYFPIPEQNIVHIGYIGRHLPTVKHRT